MIILRLRPTSKIDPVKTVEGHTGPVTSLHWNPETQRLFSAANKETKIICWDIGGKKGEFVELNGHLKPVAALFSYNQSLFSFGSDGKMIKWDMAAKRSQSAEWAESGSCQVFI